MAREPVGFLPMVTAAASLATLTVPFRVVMTSSLVDDDATLAAAGQTTATTEQTDLSIPPILPMA